MTVGTVKIIYKCGHVRYSKATLATTNILVLLWGENPGELPVTLVLPESMNTEYDSAHRFLQIPQMVSGVEFANANELTLAGLVMGLG